MINKFTSSLIIIFLLCLGFYIAYRFEFSSSLSFSSVNKVTLLDEKVRVVEGNQAPIFILSIDGGGLNGIIPIAVLQYIEENSGIRIQEIFDLMVGTSSGGIVASLIATPDKSGKAKFNLTDIQAVFHQGASKLFSASAYRDLLSLHGWIAPRYSVQKKYDLFNQYLPEMMLREALIPIAIPSFDYDNMEPIVFKSWTGDNYYMKDLLTASTSAISFYAPSMIYSHTNKKNHELLDASLYLNSPEVVALLLAQKLYPEKKYIMVSLGAGMVDNDYFAESGKHWGILQWNIKFIRLMLFARMKFNAHIMRHLITNKDDNVSSYHRFNITIPLGEVSGYDPSKQNIDKLDGYARKIISKNKKSLTELIDLIKDQHKNIESNSLKLTGEKVK
ncbi:patatin-like phospholipase family protein [Shewanella surugensis]|uniref:Patatin-like phospholipase family protein n=1 Tax=Shewanella surugensis TaxID=212020 RepID=A0ABT0LJW1_9GAMM|nr:patatin-like phospholipase family protein [Shewanella surugensis]MCL1127999.1 patatin-like phospholipase family protein [Shewanella surugensis]